jgi:small subunit ribosomal protein S13
MDDEESQETEKVEPTAPAEDTAAEDTAEPTTEPTPEKATEPEPTSEPEVEEPKTDANAEEVQEEQEVQETQETEETKPTEAEGTEESAPEPKPEPEPAQEPAPEKEPKKPKSKPAKKSKKSSDQGEEKREGSDKGEDSEENPDFKYIVRVATTNLDGNKKIPFGLTGIKGIGIRMATIITDKLGFPRDKRMGDLTDEEVEKLGEFVENLTDEVPGWMLNRQKDFDMGDDIHIISSEIQRQYRDDLNRLKKIRCYRGIRHEQGQKVRGQRTRANGRSGMTVGVMRKRVQQTQKKK